MAFVDTHPETPLGIERHSFQILALNEKVVLYIHREGFVMGEVREFHHIAVINWKEGIIVAVSAVSLWP